MPWPWGAGAINKNSKRTNRRVRRAAAKHDAGLLFETLEPRVLLNAAPFATVITHQQQQPQPLLQDANGTQLFATLTGPGQIQVNQGAGGPSLTVTGTSAASNLTLTVKGGTGHFVLGAIDLAGPMNSISGTGVDLHGKFTAEAPVHLVTLGDVQNSTFSASGSIDSLNLGKVQDSAISVAGSIGDFELKSWLSTGASNQLNAASIGDLRSVGDFDASVALSGPTGNHGVSANRNDPLLSFIIIARAGIAGLAAARWARSRVSQRIVGADVMADRDFRHSLCRAARDRAVEARSCSVAAPWPDRQFQSDRLEGAASTHGRRG